MIIIGCINSIKLAKSIAKKTKSEFSELNTKQFPDGELYLRYMTQVKRKHVVLVNTLHPNPNDAMLELIFAAKTAKELGAKKVTIVAPYLAYMRQDKRFHGGECKSNSIMAELLSCCDHLITIDPHLHRISSLNKIFKIKTTKLSANKAIREYINKKYQNAIIIGPDIESVQWAKKIAEKTGLSYFILHKKRYSSRTVKIKVKKDIKVKHKTVILVDDIISTGHTMIEPIKQLKKKGAKKIICICVHGVFVEGALERLRKIGAEVISTNSIERETSKIDVSKLIAENLLLR